MKRLLLLIATITLAGCVRPGDYPITSNCLWSEQDSHSLDLTRMSDRRHLRFDAITAEDVSIRWADAQVGLAALMVEMLGSIVIEGVALNSGHLSYRMNRIPFRQHWAMLFACG
jgi:hypothetical protein